MPIHVQRDTLREDQPSCLCVTSFSILEVQKLRHRQAFWVWLYHSRSSTAWITSFRDGGRSILLLAHKYPRFNENASKKSYWIPGSFLFILCASFWFFRLSSSARSAVGKDAGNYGHMLFFLLIVVGFPSMTGVQKILISNDINIESRFSLELCGSSVLTTRLSFVSERSSKTGNTDRPVTT